MKSAIRNVAEIWLNRLYKRNGSSNYSIVPAKRSRSFDAESPVPVLPAWVADLNRTVPPEDDSGEEMEHTDTDDDIDIRGDPSSLPPTLYVLELAAGVPAATVDWYISRVQGRRRTGGAELLVSAQPQLPGKGLVLHLTASRIKLLETAERMELRKKDRDGFLRDFTCAELDEFLGDGGVDNLLTMCEKQRIVMHELEHIRARSAEHQLPGYPAIQLYPGQSVTRLLLQEDIVVQLFPLHDPVELDRLGKSWYAALFQRQPFEDIRAYFGESVALYFSFLGFYTAALCGPAALGLLQLVFSVDTLHEYALYSLFNMLWVTVFLEAWKRKCNELAYVWGVMDKTQMSFLEPRANHRGDMIRDEITGRYMPYYPRWKTLLKLYLASIPLVVVCLFGSFYLMLVSFWAEEYLTLHRDQYGGNLAAVLIMLPSIVYSVVVLVLNKYYNKMTTFLTEWENHRTQKQYDYFRVIKLALFEFVNSFMSLFYIAFYIQDLEMLRSQLAVMLIIQQLVNNFQEALLPIVIRSTYSKVQEKVVTKLKEHKLTRKLFESRTLDAVDADDARVRVRTLEPDDPRVQDVSEQLQLDPYPDTSDDYLEMFVQFGYAFLFSSVFPMAAFWAVFNNLLEIRADAFKLCKVYQRPPAKSVRNIGAWMPAFEVLGFVAVFTNCALLCMSPALRSLAPGLTGVEWVVVFVLLEHTLLALKLTLTQVVPSVPYWIRKAVASHEYRVRQQLHRKRRRDTRQRLSRRFSSKVPTQRPASYQPDRLDSGVRLRNH